MHIYATTPLARFKKTFKYKGMKTARKFVQILALLAMCMQLTAHLSPVLAKINGNWQITICSADSVRTITIDKNGNEIPTPQINKNICAVCAVGNTLATTPDDCNIRPLAAIRKYRYGKTATTPIHNKQNPRSHAPRAPPSES